MIRIKVGNRNINEIKSDTHQYGFTKINIEKKPLDFIFGNKYRLIDEVKINVSPICDNDYKTSEAVNFCLTENSATFLKYLKLDSPRDDREAESFNKIKNSVLYKLYIEYCKKNNKKINEESVTLFYGTYLTKIVGDTMRKNKQNFLNESAVYDFSNNTILCNNKRVNLFNFFENFSLVPINSINRDVKTGRYSFEKSIEEEGLKRLREAHKLIRNLNIDMTEEAILDKLSSVRFANLSSINISYDITKIVLNNFMLEKLKIKPDEKGQIKTPDIYKTVVLSRVSRDIVRMSDFPQLQSCHSVGGDYASCAVQEAISTGGAIAYLFDQKFSDEEKQKLETDYSEFMYDPDREETKDLKYKPVGRIRLRTFILHNKNLKNANENKKIFLVVPSVAKTYGRACVDFKNYIKNICEKNQKPLIDSILNLLSNDELIGFELMGGSYMDEDDAQEMLAEFLEVDSDNFKILNTTEFKERDVVDIIEKKDVIEEYTSLFKVELENLDIEAQIDVDANVEKIKDSGLRSGHPYDINDRYNIEVTATVTCRKEYIKDRIFDLMADTVFLGKIGLTSDDEMDMFTDFLLQSSDYVYTIISKTIDDEKINLVLDKDGNISKKLGPYMHRGIEDLPEETPEKFKDDIIEFSDEVNDIMLKTSRDEQLIRSIKNKVLKNKQLQEIKKFFKRLI